MLVGAAGGCLGYFVIRLFDGMIVLLFVLLVCDSCVRSDSVVVSWQFLSVGRVREKLEAGANLYIKTNSRSLLPCQLALHSWLYAPYAKFRVDAKLQYGDLHTSRTMQSDSKALNTTA